VSPPQRRGPGASGRGGPQRNPDRGVLPGVRDAAGSDDEICRRLTEDLDGGFTALVEAYGPIVLTVATRATSAREDAEDLAAESFLRAYRALRHYDAGRIQQLRLRPWLVTIVLNVSRNARRDAARRPRADALAAGEPAAASRDTAELALAAGAVPELAARLSALPDKQRAAVVLRHVVELTTTEVALALECSEGTARSHVARGLAALRAAYQAEGPSRAAPAAGRAKGGPQDEPE